MPEEYLDIVDENGNLTGTKELRSIVHEKGLWHRTVHIFLYKRENEKVYFLVQQRSKDKDRHPDEWTIVSGGHVIAGASTMEAVKSELEEEIGLDAYDLIFIPAGIDPHISKSGKNNEFVHMFFTNFNGRVDDLHFNDGEVQAVAWKDVDEIKKEIKQFPNNWADTESRCEYYMELFEKFVIKKETSL